MKIYHHKKKNLGGRWVGKASKMEGRVGIKTVPLNLSGKICEENKVTEKHKKLQNKLMF